MKAFFAAGKGKSGYKKWKIKEPDMFLFYVQSREMPKNWMHAGVARKT